MGNPEFGSEFVFNERLGIPVPNLRLPFEKYSVPKQWDLMAAWEAIRGSIPSRVMELERVIEQKLFALGNEEDFEFSCKLNEEIAETASIINDLHIWYRITGDEPSGKRHL